MDTTAGRPARIAFVSPCGGGNLGDAAIVDSLLAGIRSRLPGAEVTGFTGNPADTSVRHGVAAFPLRARRGGASGPVASPGDASPASPPDQPAPPRRAGLRALLPAVPGLRERWRTAVRFAADARYYREVAERLRGHDLVVVAGGGQFDQLFGGAFRHPLTLWRFAAMAKQVGARFAVLSVGTGTVTPVSRLLLRRVLALADTASFRDQRSRELIGAGTERASIVPDLAYGLADDQAGDQLADQAADQPADHPAGIGPAIIGLSPMAYGDPRFWPVQDAARYRDHLASMGRLTADLLVAGHQVVLFTTDGPDLLALDEMQAGLTPSLTPEQRGRLRVARTPGVPELLQLLRGLDAVVAARFHGVLLAHVAGRPALAVAHERKVSTLMDEMGHSRFCFPIDAFDPTLASARVAELLEGRRKLSADIRARVLDHRRRVQLQYDQVLGALAGARASEAPSP